MKKLLFLIFMICGPVWLPAQNVITDTAKIRKPVFGKLYFSKKDSNLYLYTGSYRSVKYNKQIVKQDSIVNPQDQDDEVVVGYWSNPDNILIAKKFGDYYLMQTNFDRSYYVPRGINIKIDTRTTWINNSIIIKSGNSGIGGLLKPDNFPTDRLEALGYVLNEKNEYVKPGGGVSPINTEKISLPVGVIRWDGWFTSHESLLDVTKDNRLMLSLDCCRMQAPWFSTFTEPEIIKLHRWNANEKAWEYYTKPVTVKFDGDRPGIMEKECQMAKDAGIDFWAFNFYWKDTPMSIGRIQFENMLDKKGMKAAYILEHIRNGEQEIVEHIVNAMKQPWYQYIDGKPLVYLPAINDNASVERLTSFLKRIEAGLGSKCYSLIQQNSDANQKAGIVRKYGLSGSTLYASWNGYSERRPDHRYIIENEQKEWNGHLAYPDVDLGMNITTSFSNEAVMKIYPINQLAYGQKATLAEIEEQIQAAIQFIKAHPGKTKLVTLYAWNEHSENGKTVGPQFTNDLKNMDRSVLDLVKKYLE